MRFLLDMNVARSAAIELRALGHDAVHLGEEGLERLDDDAVFAKAANERRILVTFEFGFGEIAARSLSRRVSVLLLRLRDTRPPFMAARLRQAIESTGTWLEAGAIVLVDDARSRVRRIGRGTP